jgi:hypothetical protein
MPWPPDSPRRLSRRKFLSTCASYGAVLAAGGTGGLWSCSSGFESKETWILWIAQTLRGTVITRWGDGLPVPGAHVRFWGGLRPNEFALFGEKITDAAGRYEMVAEEHPGARAGFWWFEIDSSFFRSSDDDVPVYCQLEVKKPGFDIVVKEQILWRRPQKSLPPFSEGFHMIWNVAI